MDYLESTVQKHCIIMDFSKEIVQHFPWKSAELATVAQEKGFNSISTNVNANMGSGIFILNL